MFGKSLNLQRKLEVVRNKKVSEAKLLEEVYAILHREQENEERVLRELQKGDAADGNKFVFDLLEANRIFHISHIKQLCVLYRLRFLDTRYFKSKLPAEAIQKVTALEKEHQTEIKGFKIIAPSKHFKLENADDPILFAPIGNNYYYLIHKWGKDLHPLRKLLVWPLRNFETLAVFSLVFSFIMALGIREVFYSQYRTTSQFIMIYLFTFKSVLGLILYYGIALGKNFNSGIWRSKYING